MVTLKLLIFPVRGKPPELAEGRTTNNTLQRLGVQKQNHRLHRRSRSVALRSRERELIALLADISERKAMMQRSSPWPNATGLTGLYNRSYFQANWNGWWNDAVARRRVELRVVLRRPDNFKYVNDTSGMRRRPVAHSDRRHSRQTRAQERSDCAFPGATSSPCWCMTRPRKRRRWSPSRSVSKFPASSSITMASTRTSPFHRRAMLAPRRGMCRGAVARRHRVPIAKRYGRNRVHHEGRKILV